VGFQDMGTLRCDGCGEEFFITSPRRWISGLQKSKQSGWKRSLLKSERRYCSLRIRLSKLLVLSSLLYDPRSGLAEVLAGAFLLPILPWTARRLLLQLIGLPLCAVGFGALL
jgi:hypothetical protein